MPKSRYQYRYRRPQRRHFSFRLLLLALAAIGLLIYPFYEATTLNVDYHTVTVTGLPDNLKNLKIAYASDFHQGAWVSQDRVNEVVTALNGLGADIVVLGGDYGDDSDGAIAFFGSAPAIHARLGAYAVVGNNDRTAPESNLAKLETVMRAKGVTPLVNAVARVKLGQAYVYVAGVDDYYNGFPAVEEVAAQVRADDYVIFAGHSPDLMSSILAAKSADGDNHWFDLALFGHTHGGQINLFGLTPFGNLRTEVGSRYMSGWLEESRATVLVSNGVGVSRFPVRLGAPPQIHLITLKRR